MPTVETNPITPKELDDKLLNFQFQVEIFQYQYAIGKAFVDMMHTAHTSVTSEIESNTCCDERNRNDLLYKREVTESQKEIEACTLALGALKQTGLRSQAPPVTLGRPFLITDIPNNPGWNSLPGVRQFEQIPAAFTAVLSRQ